jgi:hypothetical protein
MEKRISAVIPVLMSRDVAASLRFYAMLGFGTDFTDTLEQPRYAGVSRDGVALHLQWQDAEHWNNSLDRPAYRFEVADVDALYAEFKAAGALPETSASPYRAPAQTPWGTREFHLHDPDRNSLQFFR